MRLRTKTIKAVIQVIIFSALSFFGVAQAQTNPLENGWVLQPETSSLNFQTTKNLTKVESNSFTRFNGAIQPDGQAEIEIDLESVETNVDLRNVRMRFFLFETFTFPTAKISAQINAADLADLAEVRRKKIALPFRLSLHGVEKDLSAEVAVTLLTDDLVSVATTTPI